MPSPPASTKTSLGQKLRARARERWPRLASVDVRFHGEFAYVTGHLPDGSQLPFAACGTPDTPAPGVSRSTAPATTTTRTAYLPTGQPSGTPEKPSTAPADSTSPTPPPGSHRPRR